MSRPTAADIAITAAAVAAGVLMLAFPGKSGRRGGAVVIKSVCDSTRVIDLSDDRTLVVRGALGETVIRVSDGHVDFMSSACPHKICVERGPAASEGDYIVCVPNGVSAKVVGESDFDAVVP